MVLATWWGWRNAASIVLSVGLAFFFGYLLTFTACAAPASTSGRRSQTALASRHRLDRW